MQRPEGALTGVGGAHQLLICSTEGPAPPGGLLGQGCGEEGRGHPGCESCVGGHCRPRGRPRGTAQGRGRQASGVSRDMTAGPGWDLGAEGQGDKKQQEGPHPTAPGPGALRVPGAAAPQPQGTRPGLSPPLPQATSASSR